MITYEVADGVAVMTIDRPEVRNAIDYETAEALAKTIDRFDADQGVFAGILTGANGVFCAGMDLKAVNAGGPDPVTESRGVFGICERPPEKPLVAAIERYALGGGFEIALACDLIVAAEDARFGLPEVKRGMVAAGGGMIRLPRKIASAVALELILTGEDLDASRAFELGLVNRVSATGSALSVARELAALIAANAPLATRTGKQIVDDSADYTVSEAFERQKPLVRAIGESEDAAEGPRAFTEKRPPVWRGR